MENKSVADRLRELKKEMKSNSIDVYIIPTSDFHMSEYVNEYFQCRRYFSGFTGSAGTLVVTAYETYLFTDGRYFVQAENELADSDIVLMRMGDKGIPDLEQFVEKILPQNGCIGFDGRVMSFKLGMKLEEAANNKSGYIISNIDIAEKLWSDRKELEFNDIYFLEEKYTGKCTLDKLRDVRKAMKEYGTDTYVIATLDDQAWLFNLRGNDIPCNPVFLSYAIITMETATLYTGAPLPDNMAELGVKNKGYFKFYEDLEKLRGNVLLDKTMCNYRIVKELKSANIINKLNPTTMMKAIKNGIEISNLKKCHIKDGVAVTKFMYWLKNNVGDTNITEISASEYLEGLRKEAGCVDLSFETISAYNEHAAIIHYSPNMDSNSTLKAEGLLLVDSGGQYYEGTTDITRTFILGDVSDEIKKHYTLVVKAMLQLANARFLYGCTGLNLDILARGPLWDIGMDYKCGTGHGVGYMLNVHEGPNGFRWKKVPERNDSCILKAGMVTTDEPGVYIEGSHGIRLENELVCIECEENEYGQFMGFETITLAPIDLDGIDVKWLDESDRKRLNNYHRQVFDKISPFLNDKEREWLGGYTREI